MSRSFLAAVARRSADINVAPAQMESGESMPSAELIQLAAVVPAACVLYATCADGSTAPGASSDDLPELQQLQFCAASYADVELLMGEAPTLIGCLQTDPYASAVLLLPTSLHGIRRADLHELAKLGGLQHASVGRGPSRRLVVWGRGGLQAPMLQALAAAIEPEEGRPSSSRPAAPEWALQPPTSRLWAAGMAAAAALEDAGGEGLLDVLAIESPVRGACGRAETAGQNSTISM